MNTAASPRPDWAVAFGRSQAAALIATGVDFGTLVGLVEGFGVWYVSATAMGAALGAVTHFVLGRYWSFRAADRAASPQARRYILVSAGSLLLNSVGVFAFTGGLGLHYPISKACVAILVGVFYNFPMHRRFVFR